MPFSIIIPYNPDAYEQEIAELSNKSNASHIEGGAQHNNADRESLHKSIFRPSQKPIIFYEETFSGFIIHTCSLEEGKNAPKSVQLTSVSTYDNGSDSIYNVKSRDLSQPTLNIKENKDDEILSERVISDLVFQGVIYKSGDEQNHVSIWRFDFLAECPERETSGRIKFSVSTVESDKVAEKIDRSKTIETVSSVEPVKQTAFFSKKSENLLDELNHSVFGPPPFKYELLYKETPVKEEDTVTPTEARLEIHLKQPPVPPPKDNKTADLAFHVKTRLNLNSTPNSLQIATSAPLSLKLRTTKSALRNDQLLTTLRLEAPEQLVQYAGTKKQEKYVLHVLEIRAKFSGGKITQLGSIDLPRRCDLNEVLNVTYKLVKSPGEVSQSPSDPSSDLPSSRPIDITVRVRIEKTDASNISDILDTSTTHKHWQNLTTDISTTWSPILEFDTISPFYEFPTKVPTPQSVSVSQFRSRSTHAKSSALVNTFNSKKSGAVKTYASVSALPIPNPQSSPRVGWQLPNSPNRPVTPNKSSPILSVSRGGISRKKTQKSMLSHPGMASGVAINLGGDSISVFSGLRLTFKGTSKISSGQVVTWTVQAVNQTKHVLKPVLISTAVPKKSTVQRSRVSFYNEASKSASFQSLAALDDKSTSKGSGIMNRLHLYEQYKVLGPEKCGIIILSTDVSLGVLEPGQVYESEFSYVSISKGTFTLSGLRVVDAFSGEIIDIGKLLEVYVV